MFLAQAGEPPAESAARVPPAAPGRVLGLDRALEVKTIRRSHGELAAAGEAGQPDHGAGRGALRPADGEMPDPDRRSHLRVMTDRPVPLSGHRSRRPWRL